MSNTNTNKMNEMISLSNIMTNTDWFIQNFFLVTMEMTDGKKCITLDTKEGGEKLNIIFKRLKRHNIPINRESVMGEIRTMATLFLIFS